MSAPLENRLAALEQKVQRLEWKVKEQLDLYRSIQVSDEETIRDLYNSVQSLQRIIERLLPDSNA